MYACIVTKAYRIFGKYTQSRRHGVQEITSVRLTDSPVENWGCQAASNESRAYEEDVGGCAHHLERLWCTV